MDEMKNGVQIAPSSVELVYRVVGETHVFSSREILGLLHIGSVDRKTAFTNVISRLSKHVTAAYNCSAAYKCEMSYDEFAQHIDAENDMSGNFLTLKLDERPTERRCT